MESKKILIVSRSFYPENTPRGFRTTELTKQFARMGHSVTVITPRKKDLHNAFEKEHGVEIKDLGAMKWKPVSVKGGGLNRLFRRVLVRAASLLVLYPDIECLFRVRKALKREKGNYDLLLTIAAPHPVHWATAMTLKNSRPIAKRWIADCGDPFMGGENDTFKRLFYFKYFEKWFCRKADFITVPIAEAIPAYYPEFRNKIKVIPQGFRFEDVRLKNQVKQNKVPTFAYAGTLIPRVRDPHEFFEFLNKTTLDYKFFIYTGNTDYAQKYAAGSGGRIEVRPPVPRLELLDRLQEMDFVVNFENKGARQSPSKLIDYVILKKPVLSIKTFGFSSDTFLEFLHKDYKNQLLVEDPDQYRIEVVSQKMIDLIEH